MPFEIVRNDIVNMQVDVIVNTANPHPVIGAGTDAAIHAKAGPKLLKARQKIGNISVGCAEITRGYDLDAKYVIHTVGPVWQDGKHGEEHLLRQCYDASLTLALKKKCCSIAFPLISSGTYGFPKALALQTAINAISAFLMAHEMTVYLVVFDRDAFRLSEKLFHSVASYIDENYVDAREQRFHSMRFRREMQVAEELFECRESAVLPPTMSAPAPKAASLDERLSKTDAGFTETLLKLIDQTEKKDSEIYNKANVSRQHFSKIRNNPGYKPTKATALAFAIALELGLDETKDLIGRAGYALTNSSKFDVIIMYFIEQKNYNLFEINATLFEFDQSLLGA